MPTTLSTGASASNALTARWVDAIGARGEGFVVSGAAVWPLLAALAAGAVGRARDELEAAIGLPATEALPAAMALLEDMERSEAVHAALGVWSSDDVPIRDSWSARLPSAALGRLSGELSRDQAALDAWVKEHTFGILDRLPIGIDEETELLLAQAIALRTDWVTAFEELPLRPRSGPWADRILKGLHGTFEELDNVVVFDTDEGDLTTFCSVGVHDVDVYLILGEQGAAPSVVLREAVAAVGGQGRGRGGSELRPGDTAPGLVVEETMTDEAMPPSIDVWTISFDMRAEHDLLADARLFGLVAASDRSESHFEGISEAPLFVGEAHQSVRSIFSATGFEAAAVTEVGLRMLGMVDQRYTRRVIRIAFDRPFGFLAMQRELGIVLFAGWVQVPDLSPHPVLSAPTAAGRSVPPFSRTDQRRGPSGRRSWTRVNRWLARP